MGLELAEILRQYGSAYRQKYRACLSQQQGKVLYAIEHCRTETLGGQVYRCEDCGQERYSYHSCRDRHCPKCQQQQTEEWLAVQRELLLPVPYFLLTFTLPAELRVVASRNQMLIYSLLFTASAEAAQKLARDGHYVGGQIALVGVLHTWTRNLAYHPHVHYLAPGGGLSATGEWLRASQGFFLPVRALSKLFRAAFRRRLRKTALYAQVNGDVWRKDWVVHCKAVGNGQAALKYLAPYIHRVAISNRRLISLEPRGSLETSQVTFQYRTSDTGRLRLCTLSVEDFLSRFLMHVLPPGFVKVRYYGFFGASVRGRLAALQRALGPALWPPAGTTPGQAGGQDRQPEAVQATDARQAGTEPRILCPQCGKPMLLQRSIPPFSCRSP